MTNMEKVMLGLSAGSGIAGAVASGKQNSQSRSDQQRQELDMAVQRMMASLQNAQQTGQNLQTNRQQMPQTQAELSPLGQEQSFLQKQRLMQTLLPSMAGMSFGAPTDPGVAGAYKAPTNLMGMFNNPKLLESFGDKATSQSLADRRQLMAQINPDYQFNSLDGFGLDANYDKGVNQASMDAGARLRAYESAQSALADQQIGLANQGLTQAQLSANSPAEKKGGGLGGFLGGVLKTAAPFAAFIPGVGPLAAVGLGAAGGALGNKLQGGGLVSGAIQGGIGAGVGAAGKSLAGGQGLNPFNNGSGKAMLDATGKAVTSASQVGPSFSQMVGGQVEDAGNSPMLGLMENWNTGNPMQSPFPGGQQVYNKPAGPDIGRIVSGLGGSKRPPQGQQVYNQPAGPHIGQPQTLPTGGQITGIGPGEPQGWGSWLWDQVKEQPAIGVAQSPVGGLMAGAGIGGLAKGANAMALRNSASNLGQAAPKSVATGVGQMNRATDVSRAARNAGFDKMWQQGMKTPTAPPPVNPNESAIAEIMMALGNMGKSMPGQGAALNNAAQGLYKAVPGKITQQIGSAAPKGFPSGMTPQQIMQMIIRGGG